MKTITSDPTSSSLHLYSFSAFVGEFLFNSESSIAQLDMMTKQYPSSSSSC
ncbi:unnamed protein product [Penicillium salamii]|nr:unnamed protein product [Penicillium salamii]